MQFQNLFAQLVSLVGARKTYCELGRGSAKTTDVQCERLVDVMYDMPGAPCAWVADTFQNLTTNILPSVLEGLERKGFREGVHFVIEKEPPVFTEAEKSDLPDWLRPPATPSHGALLSSTTHRNLLRLPTAFRLPASTSLPKNALLLS